MMKNKIIFIAPWYPTNDNTIRGGFFRERAKLLESVYDVEVLHVEQFFISFYNLFKIIRFFINRKLVNSRELLNDPPAYYSEAFGIKESRLLLILPHYFYKKIKVINHFFLKKAYNRSIEIIVKKSNRVPDLLYAASIQTCGAYTYYLSKIYDIPYVLSEHSNFSTNSLSRIDTKKSIEEAGAIISISHDKTRQILFCNVSCNPIYVGNMVDGGRFPLKRNSTPTNIFTIITVASYTWMKDYDTFFKVVQDLKKISAMNFKVLVIGIGRDSSKVQQFNHNLIEYNIVDKVELYESIERDSMGHYYHMADALLMTSIAEGMPNAVLEAMSCGLPVFATKCGGVEDIVDEKCGRLFNLKEYREISSSLNQFMNAEFTFDAEYIRNRVLTNYGRERYLHKMTSIINNLIDPK